MRVSVPVGTLRVEKSMREEGAYFFAMNVYFPLSSDSLSSQITVHLPSPLNLAFTAPFFVSYATHVITLLGDDPLVEVLHV